MYSADELNLVRMPDEIPKYQLQEPRTINAYIGLGGKLLLLGSVGRLSHLYFAALSRAEDEAQNTVLLDAMYNETSFHLKYDDEVLKEICLTSDQLSHEWIIMENEQDEIREKTPAGCAGVLSHAYRLLFAEAAARAAGGIYIQSVECWLKECEALEKLPDEQAFYKRYGALKRILKADECMLLSDDPFVRSAYLKFQKTLRKVSLRFYDFQRK